MHGMGYSFNKGDSPNVCWSFTFSSSTDVSKRKNFHWSRFSGSTVRLFFFTGCKITVKTRRFTLKNPNFREKRRKLSNPDRNAGEKKRKLALKNCGISKNNWKISIQNRIFTEKRRKFTIAFLFFCISSCRNLFSNQVQ